MCVNFFLTLYLAVKITHCAERCRHERDGCEMQPNSKIFPGCCTERWLWWVTEDPGESGREDQHKSVWQWGPDSPPPVLFNRQSQKSPNPGQIRCWYQTGQQGRVECSPHRIVRGSPGYRPLSDIDQEQD